MKLKPMIIAHSGAGSGKFSSEDPRYKELRNTVGVGLSVLKSGSSLDAVVEAVSYMEDAGVFNAGKGACLTVDGRIQLDAGVMRGDSLKGAGVGMVTCTYHPVTLARWVMENTKHVLVVGEECKTYAEAAGIKPTTLEPTRESLAKRERLLQEAKGDRRSQTRLWHKLQEGGTVGAVAMDSEGVPAAAVSTGGMWLKLPGRVGDSAILGAGIYADRRAGAACATGMGEEIIKNALCLKACEFLRKWSAPTAARLAISMISRRSGRGTAGIITLDSEGRVGASFNTEAMGRGWYDRQRDRIVVRIS